VMSHALAGLGVVAMLSPLAGGMLVQWLDWHAALLVLALFGAATLAFVGWRFEETVPQRNPAATQLRPLLRNWAAVLRHPAFRAWAALLSLSYGGLFLFLAASSFVFIDVLGTSRVAYGALMASNSLAYIGGTLICRRLLVSRGLRGTVKLGAGFTLAGGLSSVLLSLAGVHTVWAVIVPQWAYSLGHGFHQPCGQVGAIGPFPEKAGTAAALSGFLMMATAFAIGLWLGGHLNGTVYPLTLGLGVFGTGVAAVAWTLVQRHGEPQRAPAAQAA
ncbi:MAG TPA: MFS transporter, partial [Albitalea sp.]|nr:MFS transporter [Albitalea sp.]